MNGLFDARSFSRFLDIGVADSVTPRGAPLRHISRPVYKEDDAGDFMWNGLRAPNRSVRHRSAVGRDLSCPSCIHDGYLFIANPGDVLLVGAGRTGSTTD